MMNPLATMLSAQERPGVLRIVRAFGDSYLEALGYTPADHLRVIEGEDRLHCYLEGTIEGAPCDLDESYTALDTDFQSGIGINEPYDSAAGTVLTGDIPTGRLYLVRPHVTAAIPNPGETKGSL